MAEVIHVDREAAWAVRSAPYMDEICRDRWMAGVYDNVPGSRIQAFARHRTEAVKPLVEALTEIGLAAKLSAALSDPDEREPWEMIEARCDAALRSAQS